jgi:hypothetical protein
MLLKLRQTFFNLSSLDRFHFIEHHFDVYHASITKVIRSACITNRSIVPIKPMPLDVQYRIAVKTFVAAANVASDYCGGWDDLFHDACILNEFF